MGSFAGTNFCGSVFGEILDRLVIGVRLESLVENGLICLVAVWSGSELFRRASKIDVSKRTPGPANFDSLPASLWYQCGQSFGANRYAQLDLLPATSGYCFR